MVLAAKLVGESHMMSNDDKKKTVEIQTHWSVPSFFADNLGLLTRNDGLHLLIFTTAFHDGHKEQARIFVPTASLRRMIDMMCSHCDHYPAKPRSKRQTGKKSTKKKES